MPAIKTRPTEWKDDELVARTTSAAQQRFRPANGVATLSSSSSIATPDHFLQASPVTPNLRPKRQPNFVGNTPRDCRLVNTPAAINNASVPLPRFNQACRNARTRQHQDRAQANVETSSSGGPTDASYGSFLHDLRSSSLSTGADTTVRRAHGLQPIGEISDPLFEATSWDSGLISDTNSSSQAQSQYIQDAYFQDRVAGSYQATVPSSTAYLSASSQYNGAAESSKNVTQTSPSKVSPPTSIWHSPHPLSDICDSGCYQRYGKDRSGRLINASKAFECPELRWWTKKSEVKRNERMSETYPDCSILYRGLDWVRMCFCLKSRGASAFALNVLEVLHDRIHPQPVELHTLSDGFFDEKFRPHQPGGRGRHISPGTNPDLDAAKRLLAILNEEPDGLRDYVAVASHAHTTKQRMHEIDSLWMEKFKEFWYVILHVVTQLPLGDPRQEKLVRILDKLYGQCQRDKNPANYQNRDNCNSTDGGRAPYEFNVDSLFKKEIYLWLWERLPESWNAYEMYAPLFRSVIIRERDKILTASKWSSENIMLEMAMNCVPGEKFVPYRPSNHAMLWSSDEWVRLNSFLARLVSLRGKESPFAHASEKDGSYNMLWLKGLYCMIEAFEVSCISEDSELSQLAANNETLLAALGAASQWILLGGFTPTWLHKNSVHLRRESVSRSDIRNGRHPYAFGNLYPLSLSDDFATRFKFWVARLDQIIDGNSFLVWRVPHILDLARHARKYVEEQEIGDIVTFIMAHNQTLSYDLEEKIRRKQCEKRTERDQQHQREQQNLYRRGQRRQAEEHEHTFQAAELDKDTAVRKHVIKVEATDQLLYDGKHPRGPVKF